MPSLKSILTELQDPTPAELDPEDAYHSLDAGIHPTYDADDANAVNAANGQGSGVRKSTGRQVADDPRYEGKRVSREQIMNGWGGSSNDEDDEDDDEGGEDGLGVGGSGAGASQSEENEATEEDDQEVIDEAAESDSQDDAEDEEDDTAADDLRSFKPAPHLLNSHQDASRTDGDQEVLLGQLKASATADLEKGQAVRKQLALYNKLLGVRIRMQKMLTAVNHPPDTVDTAGSAKDVAANDLLKLAHVLADLRGTVMETNDSLDISNIRKRKRIDDQEGTPALSDSLLIATDLDSILRPHTIATLSKWSSKINAASSLSLNGGAKKLSAVQMDAGRQLETLWRSEHERARLVARTRVRRNDAQGGKKDATALQDADVFDDRDFYHSLLKEVVDASGAALEAIPSARLQRTRRADVDHRASKGRKIRYDVHDKIVDFMVPQGEESEWTEERRDELFAGLLGRGWGEAIPAAPSGDADVGQLRVFG